MPAPSRRRRVLFSHSAAHANRRPDGKARWHRPVRARLCKPRNRRRRLRLKSNAVRSRQRCRCAVPAGWREAHLKSRNASIARIFIRPVTRIRIARDELVVGFCAQTIGQEHNHTPHQLGALPDGGSMLVPKHSLNTDNSRALPGTTKAPGCAPIVACDADGDGANLTRSRTTSGR